MLHDDNLKTRDELQTTRKELRENMHALENRVDKQFDKLGENLKEISEKLLDSAPRPK